MKNKFSSFFSPLLLRVDMENETHNIDSKPWVTMKISISITSNLAEIRILNLPLQVYRIVATNTHMVFYNGTN